MYDGNHVVVCVGATTLPPPALVAPDTERQADVVAALQERLSVQRLMTVPYNPSVAERPALAQALIAALMSA